jgi:5-methylcytosine-specific restriction endonuclease McrA
MREKFDSEFAIRLWTDVYNSGFEWDCCDEVVRIAAMCGLGVLTCKAKADAVSAIRKDYRVNGRYSQERYRQLRPSECAPRWANCLLAAATRYPPGKNDYPIPEPRGHVVGIPPCLGQARKGDWTDTCYRAAWGNVLPHGLEVAEKLCPRCNRLMKYWCWGKRGDPGFRWVIDHVKPHAAGGCVCRFNLQALCPSCNSSKGMY